MVHKLIIKNLNQTFLENSQTIRTMEIDSLWRLKNLGSSCWFYSMIQAFLSSDISARFNEHFSNETITTDLTESSDLDKAIRTVAKLWEYMISKNPASNRLPESMLLSALRNVCIAIPGFTQNVQQDAQEMNTVIRGHISDIL